MNWSEEELAARLTENPSLRVAGETARPKGRSSTLSAGLQGSKIGTKKARLSTSKYHAQRTGHYASKKEAAYADELALRKQAGEISFWLEQTPFKLPGVYTDKRGRTRRAAHRLDVITFKHVTGDLWKLEFTEVKGRDLLMGKLKRMQTEEIYGIKIQVV